MMLKNRLVLTATLLYVAALKADIACFGPEQAEKSIIYFHGIDKVNPGYLERRNRRVLASIANRLQVKIAAPRGNSICRGGDVCWKHQGHAVALKTLNYSREKSASCIKNRNILGFIGFSNGGYLLNSIYKNCGLNKGQFAIIIGATGVASYVGEKIKSCGKMIIHQGTKDLMYKKSKIYANDLIRRGFPVRFSEFVGGHELKVEPLMELIQAQIR